MVHLLKIRKKLLIYLLNKYFSEIGKTLSEKIEISDLRHTNFLKQTDRLIDLNLQVLEWKKI